MSCNSFPLGVSEKDETDNPAILLFGNRLFGDQSAIELLIEFLLVASSPKQVSPELFTSPLPASETLANWSKGVKLRYAPKARLSLKLFAFMGASRLDSRHKTHRQQYKDLLDRLQSRIQVMESGTENDVLRTLENLLLGFQGAGSGRTWCAQSFVPVCPGFLAGETIWSEAAARSGQPESWDIVIGDLQKYFHGNKHLFLARGGEVLYLQLCNALSQSPDKVRQWVQETGVQLEAKEQEPGWLHGQLQHELERLLMHCPQTVTDIAEFIDSGVEPETAEATDFRNGVERFVDAGWCPAESWREGYLFAVDLLRLCTADLDVIERLKLLEVACAMQVLRSLAAQSARHSPPERLTSRPNYRMAVSAPDEKRLPVKRISQHTVRALEKLVYRAVRGDGAVLPENEKDKVKILKEADTRYGSKLFISTAKRIGLLVPRRGAGARFTLNEQLLRLLVVTTVPVGGRLTYDTFKALVEARHGLVFDGPGFSKASAWADGVENIQLGSHCDAWLQEMLAAAGLLIHLSDSCALVENPASKEPVQEGSSVS